MILHYLATPYSKYPEGVEAAYRLACEQTALLIRSGVAVFSPIAHTHGVAVHGRIDPLDHTIWIPADKPFMDVCGAIIMLRAEGWGESYGMAVEMKAFRAARKLVLWMDPGVVPRASLERPLFQK